MKTSLDNILEELCTDIETSVELDSMKLELGQEKFFYWSVNNRKVASYTLEQVINMLPATIVKEDKVYCQWVWNEGIGYYRPTEDYSFYNMEDHLYQINIDSYNLSLATVAARLLIKIIKDGNLPTLKQSIDS